MHPIVNIALRAARRAGLIILRAVDRVDTLNVEEKAKNDLVSEIDRDAEAAIIDTIHKAYPEHAIIGEENGVVSVGGADGSADGSDDETITWIVDPLDGTTNFIHGIPHHCTSIGIRQGNTLLHGVIVDHLRNEEFTATRGEGAYLNGKRIRVSSTAKIDSAVLATGIPYAKMQTHGDAYSDYTRDFADACRALRRSGSAALDLAYVACGRYDGFVELGIREWDMAGGAVIVREAGGFVGDADGGDRFLQTGNVVAANPRIFKAMLRSIRAATKRQADQALLKG